VAAPAANAGRGWGNLIAIEHDLGGGQTYVTIYAHLYAGDPSLPAIGGRVTKGQVIGTIGKGYDNNEYPAHLHFELRRGTNISAGPGYSSSYE
jgi:murein DD-endopeptidase MepM/ murein hydrolase activator NlpD